MKVKTGASIAGLQRCMTPVLIVADGIWHSLKQELVVTSGLDGTHSVKSLHYCGKAVDLCTRYFNDTQKAHAVKLLKEQLGFAYTVLSEPTHIHVQFNY